MSSNQALIDSLTSRQIFIERYSKGEAKRLFRHLEKLSRRLKTMVKNDYQRINAVKLAKQVSILTNTIISEYGEDLVKGLAKFAEQEAEFASQAITAATSAELINPASFNQIQAVLTNKKMQLINGKRIQKLTVNQAAKQFTRNRTREVVQLLRDGATTGKTSQELVSDISNLIGSRTKSQAASLVRTTTNHMGAQARQATYKENDDVVTGEEYVATLDSHTTIECSSLDGNIYPIGKGAIPPIHWSCRSLRVPVINPEYNLGSEVTGLRASQGGEVSAQTTYGGWLKKQNKAIQVEVLGVERAKLFRSGKLAIGRFTDDIGRVYTLNELKKLNPIAFTAPKKKVIRKAVKAKSVKPVIKKAEFQEFKTSQEAGEWAVERGYVKTSDYGKVHVSVANEANRSLHDHMTDYPELKGSFSFVGSAQSLNRNIYNAQINYYKEVARERYPDRDALSLAKRWSKKPRTSGEWAFARGKSRNTAMQGFDGIAFNEKYATAKGLPALKSGLDSSLRGKFHPPKCDTIKSIMDHEMGHQIDYLLELRKDPDIIALHRKWGGNIDTLSGYARENIAEFIAEAWAEYRNNPSPREISKLLGDLIDAKYKARFSA